MEIAATVAALHKFPPPTAAAERQLSAVIDHTWHTRTPTILEQQPKLNKQSGLISESGSTCNPITKPKVPAFTFPNVILNPNSDNQMKPSTKRRGRHSSPARSPRPAPDFPSSDASDISPRRRTPSSSASLASNRDTIALFQDLQISEDYVSSVPEPRSFPNSVKLQCWEKAEKVKGRDPARWRRDPLGNIVFRKLVGCPGCLCHDYDHIVPYSKGGKSTLENCQVLQ
ncbi:hypothetical protein LINGRAHAP2_LOCUS18207 [Linum grandiflorum]